MHFKWNYETPSPEQQKAAEELAAKTMDYLVNKNAIPKDIRKKLGI